MILKIFKLEYFFNGAKHDWSLSKMHSPCTYLVFFFNGIENGVKNQIKFFDGNKHGVRLMPKCIIHLVKHTPKQYARPNGVNFWHQNRENCWKSVAKTSIEGRNP